MNLSAPWKLRWIAAAITASAIGVALGIYLFFGKATAGMRAVHTIPSADVSSRNLSDSSIPVPAPIRQNDTVSAIRDCNNVFGNLPKNAGMTEIQAHFSQLSIANHAQISHFLLHQVKEQTDQAQRSAALFFEIANKGNHILALPEYAEPDCKNDACELTYQQTLRQAIQQARQPAVNLLADIARHSSDPGIYALAYYSCRQQTMPTSGYCLDISARQWAQRDPDNGKAWLAVLSDIPASQKADMDDAIYHLSQAKFSNARLNILADFIQSPAMQQVSGEQQLFLHLLNLTSSGSADSFNFAPVMNYCSTNQLSDVNRQQSCHALSNLLLQDDSDMLSMRVGLILARQLNMPPEELQLRQQELDALFYVSLSNNTHFFQIPSELPQVGNTPPSREKTTAQDAFCRNLVIARHHFLHQQQEGEGKYLRRKMRESKLSSAELARKFQEFRQQLHLQYQEAP